MAYPTLVEVCATFVKANHMVENGMRTTASFDFREEQREGNVQLKYWKATGTLIVKARGAHALRRGTLASMRRGMRRGTHRGALRAQPPSADACSPPPAKEVHLDMAAAQPKGRVTAAARALLADDALLELGLQRVRLESVVSETLLDKLQKVGWTVADGNCANMSAGACVFCNEPYGEYGNNPAPASDVGKCCDSCNATVVIRARLGLVLAGRSR